MHLSFWLDHLSDSRAEIHKIFALVFLETWRNQKVIVRLTDHSLMIMVNWKYNLGWYPVFKFFSPILGSPTSAWRLCTIMWHYTLYPFPILESESWSSYACYVLYIWYVEELLLRIFYEFLFDVKHRISHYIYML